MGSQQDIFSAVFQLSSSITQNFEKNVQVTLNIQLPEDKKVEDSCLAKYSSTGWICVSDLSVVTSQPLAVQGSLDKETTATYAVVTNPKQKDDSKKNQDVVKYGIIAGCSFAGLVVVGGFITMTVLYKTKASRREKQRFVMQSKLESSMEYGYSSSQVDLPN